MNLLLDKAALHRTFAVLGCCVLAILGMALPSVVYAGIPEARKLVEKGMAQFHQKKYMAAVRFYGQSLGALPEKGADKERARSLFYIGLCYHRLKHRAPAVGAWKRFLEAIKKVPNANKSQEWSSRIRLAKAVISGGAPSKRQPPPGPGGNDGGDGNQPPGDRNKPGQLKRVNPPVRPGGQGNNINVMQQPKATPLWLARVRRCLRKRARDARDAVRRLRYCRDRMPQGERCPTRCRTVKERISRKIQQLQRRGDVGRGDRNNGWMDRGDPHREPGANPRGSRDRRDGGTTYRRQRPRRSPLLTVGTTVTTIGVVAGLLGLGFWLYGNSVVEDRDKLFSETPSPANTTAIVNRHNTAVGMQTAAWVCFSTAGAGVALGFLFFTIGKRTSYRRVSVAPIKAPPAKANQYPNISSNKHAVTLFSTGLQP